MTGLILCLIAFGTTYWAGKRSLGIGIVGLLTFGYFFGIIRANLLSTTTYFIFDAALVGLYLSQKWSASSDSRNASALRTWFLLLLFWPVLLLLMPFQPLLVSLVGLRGCVFFLPMLWLGSRLRERDLYQVSMGIAALNLAALGFALAEYVLGVPRFFPMNVVTQIIYNSRDVAGGFLRIPATFSSAHAFGGMMVYSIPYLIGIWDQAENPRVRLLAVLGAAAALLGVLLCAARLDFVLSVALVLVAIWNGRMKASRRALFAILIAILMIVALKNERLQRFKTLSDTDAVEGRISGSVNRGFFEILIEHPLGNGLGGGGTNMPSFLQSQVRNPIGLENEYARILSEQGVIGLMLWMGFIGWFLSRTKVIFRKGPWATSRRLIWGLSIVGLATGVMGTGLLASIPGTAVLLLGMGFVASPLKSQVAERRRVGMRQPMVPQRTYQPLPSQ
ncbi:MAG: O-antigen ligase family protein [Bryobacteraceae bacterium]